VKLWVEKRPTRFRSLPGAQPASLQRTSIPPPVRGAVPASIVIVVEVTAVTSADLRGGRNLEPTSATVIWVRFTGGAAWPCWNANAREPARRVRHLAVSHHVGQPEVVARALHLNTVPVVPIQLDVLNLEVAHPLMLISDCPLRMIGVTDPNDCTGLPPDEYTYRI